MNDILTAVEQVTPEWLTRTLRACGRLNDGEITAVAVRRTLETPLLRRYHRRLEELGVQGYSWEDLWRDYRLSAIQSLYAAVEWGGATARAIGSGGVAP